MTTSRASAMAVSSAKTPLSSHAGNTRAELRYSGVPPAHASGDGTLAPRSAVLRVELLAEVCRDRAHAVDAGLALGIGVVIGIGVDVVRMDFAAAVGDELDPGDADVVVGKKPPVALDDRMGKALDDPEPRARRRA